MGGGGRGIAIGLLAPAGVLAAMMVEAWPVTVDDAYISLRHARHWLEAGAPSFDAGQRIEAYSNFAWMAFGAGVMGLGWDAVLASKVLGAVCALAAIPFTYLLTRRLGGSPAAGLYAACLLGLSAGLGFWAVTGLETACYALLLAAGVWLLLGDRPSPWGAALCLGLAALTRLEGVVLVGAVAGARVALDLSEGRGARRVLREHVWVLALAAGYVAYFLWRWQYYGHLFPSSIYFKRIGETQELTASYTADFVRGSWPLLAAAAAAPWVVGRRAWVPLACAAAALAVFASARVEVLDGVSTMAFYDRYLVPVLPCLCACAAVSLEGARRRLGSAGPRRAAFVGLAGFLLLWQGVNPNANLLRTLPRTRNYPDAVAERNVPAARYLQDRFGETGRVVAGDIGLLGYLYRGTLWDLYGLATYDRTLGHGGALEPYLRELLARRPDAIMLCWDATAQPPRACMPAERALTAQPDFSRHYERRASFGAHRWPQAQYAVFELKDPAAAPAFPPGAAPARTPAPPPPAAARPGPPG